MNNSQTIKHLDNILQYLHDSYNGYHLNKDDVADHRLKNIFGKLCVQRLQMINEIKAKIKGLGGEPTERRTVAGTVHQWYQDIKNAVTGGDPLSISKQIRFGESALINAYKEALNEKLPEEIRQKLMSQLSEIEDGLKEVEMEAVS